MNLNLSEQDIAVLQLALSCMEAEMAIFPEVTELATTQDMDFYAIKRVVESLRDRMTIKSESTS